MHVHVSELNDQPGSRGNGTSPMYRMNLLAQTPEDFLFSSVTGHLFVISSTERTLDTFKLHLEELLFCMAMVIDKSIRYSTTPSMQGGIENVYLGL